MQTMRREWIDEGKPKSSFDKDLEQSRSTSSNTNKAQGPSINANRAKERAGSAPIPDADSAQPQQRPHTPPGPSLEADDDLYNVTPGAMRVTRAPSKGRDSSNDGLFVRDDNAGPRPDEDELDMLLAGDTANSDVHQKGNEGGSAGRTSALPAADDFQDEMEAMAGMDDMW